MAKKDKFWGLTVEAALSQIMQKHFKDLDAEDFAFLKAREEYLTEAQKRIYLQGEDPVEVLQESGRALTRTERVIEENRPLLETEVAVREAREKAEAEVRNAALPKVGEAKTEADEALVKERKAVVKSLEKEVTQAEKDAEAAAKEQAKADKKAAAEAAKAAKEAKE